MTELPILYSFRRCPYAMRARMALLASGTACEIREVKLSAKPAELIAVSPKATVPVLVLPDGTVIDQSVDIMRWALGRDDLGASLLKSALEPSGLPATNEAQRLIEAHDGPFKHHLDRYKYPDRHDADPVVHRDAAVAILAGYEDRLQRHAYLLGDTISIADIAIMPFVRQFAAVDRAWFDAQPLPDVQRWLTGLVASTLFEQAMVRLSPWRPGDALIAFGAA